MTPSLFGQSQGFKEGSQMKDINSEEEERQ